MNQPTNRGCWHVVLATLLLGALAHGKDGENTRESDDQLIARLIQQLGAKEFATREKAQAELQKLGLKAFDAVLEAQQHDDIEIASRSKYIVRGLHPTWHRETDPPDVKKLLRGYGEQTEDERRNRMEQLAKMEHLAGLEPLCRLTQFELEDRLSKRAALLIMGLVQPPTEKEVADVVARRIGESLGSSRRTGSGWVRLYARTLNDPESAIRDWDRAARHEQEVYLSSPDRPSREVARDLLRWQAELLTRLGRASDSVAVTRRTIKLLDGTREELIDTSDWIAKQELWALIEEMAKYFPDRFNDIPQLTYRLAEAQLRLGRKDVAQQTADKALQANVTSSQEHILVAHSLQERGLFDWAEREYRLVLEREMPGSFHDLRTRFLLSEMLHDGQQDNAAAQVLQIMVDVMDKDQSVLDLVSRLKSGEVGGVRSRMYYFYAEHAAAMGNTARQREMLEKAVQNDPTDADALIAMYRVPNADQRWKEKTRELIKAAAEQFRMEITVLRQRVEQVDDPSERDAEHQQLALNDNQFAWLVGNTEGDYDDALRASHESLELKPDSAGYLDTLGRCYYAKGDLENAIKFQSKAVKLEPHTRQIRRQLEFFTAELAKKKAADK